MDKLKRAVEDLLDSLRVRGLLDERTAFNILTAEEYMKFGAIRTMASKVKEALELL